MAREPLIWEEYFSSEEFRAAVAARQAAGAGTAAKGNPMRVSEAAPDDGLRALGEQGHGDPDEPHEGR